MCVKQALKKAQKNKKTFGNSFIYDGYINVTINSKTTNFQMRYHLSCLSGNTPAHSGPGQWHRFV